MELAKSLALILFLFPLLALGEHIQMAKEHLTDAENQKFGATIMKDLQAIAQANDHVGHFLEEHRPFIQISPDPNADTYTGSVIALSSDGTLKTAAKKLDYFAYVKPLGEVKGKPGYEVYIPKSALSDPAKALEALVDSMAGMVIAERNLRPNYPAAAKVAISNLSISILQEMVKDDDKNLEAKKALATKLKQKEMIKSFLKEIGAPDPKLEVAPKPAVIAGTTPHSRFSRNKPPDSHI